MARKGSRKVRTGCLTCKIRKVKCDEAKPFCQRCEKTGRKCDGYMVPWTPDLDDSRRKYDRYILPWTPDPADSRMLYQYGGTETEARALQFFCEVAGPSLSGPIEPSFWTKVVMQICCSQPAVKHSVIAISSFYEEVEAEVQSGKKPQHTVALKHYNTAIQELKKMDNQPLVLLVCLLFVCMELLQSNQGLAVQHCNHGLAILKQCISETWVTEHLAPMFRRLCAVPLFFGGDFANFPDLNVFEYPIPREAEFSSFSDAQGMIDDIFNRTVRLVRWGEEYCVGDLRHKEVNPRLLEEQKRTEALLAQWQALFDKWESRVKPSTVTELQRSFLVMRHQTCQVWARMAFCPEESGYDKHVDNFKRIVEESALVERNNNRSLVFCFEMAFTPMLFSIVMKCRDLTTRLEALRLIKVHGVPKESLWESQIMHAIGRRLIEIEHGAILDDKGQLSPMPVACPGMPPEERRIHRLIAEPSEGAQAGVYGGKIRGTRVKFFMRTLEGKVFHHSELLATDEAPASFQAAGSKSPESRA
ncbi:hypothetical protein CEP54_011453 [Fusarium duplospermum]|uniref:Zn(2)-C6 fungal-type domain-containing protein n=1 Tax=Fusarium duplospermum TaxID=1325734 RepID=A0A428PEG0_9HYPO|nr:hypothetical protein CEP54_011453 [Fusarium duplospermum]